MSDPHTSRSPRDPVEGDRGWKGLNHLLKAYVISGRTPRGAPEHRNLLDFILSV